MEFDELLITTGVDGLVRLVKEKQRIGLPAASKLLNIPESTLEEWARILEEEKIIRIEYKLTKSFLVWIQPTEEEVKREQTSFYEEKKELGKEISSVRTRLKPEVNELEQMQQALAQTYEKLGPRLNALEQATKGVGEVPVVPTSLEETRHRIDTLKETLSRLQKEWEELEKKVTKPLTPADAKPPKVKELLATLKEMEKKAQTLKKGVPTELPVTRDIEKKAAELKREFHEVRSREARLRDDLRSVSETQEIVQEMRGQLERYTTNIEGMHNELDQLAKQFRSLKQQSDQFFKRIKEEQEAMERFSDSLNIAKDILSKYPSQQRAIQELEALSEKEKQILEKMDAVEKLLLQLGSPKQLVDEFLALQKRIQKEREALKSGAEEYTHALQEQKSLYGTFEKIRTKTLGSVKEYKGELTGLRTELNRVEKESQEVESNWEKQTKQWKKKMKTKDFQELAKVLRDVRSKKKLLEELKQTLDTSHSQAENLNRRLNLLAQQAKLLEIRAGKGKMPTAEKKEKEQALRTQLSLTKKEEEEFRRKREELRALIKKLWEQS